MLGNLQWGTIFCLPFCLYTHNNVEMRIQVEISGKKTTAFKALNVQGTVVLFFH